MGTIVVTGSAGGIGTALRRTLGDAGHHVVGVDRRDAEVVADLATDDGRTHMVAEVLDRTGGVVDGLVVAAGVLQGQGPTLVAVNYFGALAALEGLRAPLVRSGGAAVVVGSNSATCQEGVQGVLVEACLAGQESRAQRLARDDQHGFTTYPATKLALARWVRRHAVTSDWIGAGVRLNAVAPGLVDTPMTGELLDAFLGIGDDFPVPAGRAARPAEVAGLIHYLLGPDAGFFCGSVICMDGGTEAALRGEEWPVARGEGPAAPAEQGRG